MKLTQLTTHYNADEAYTVIEFLDRLREILWAAYGEEIIEMLKAATENNPDKSEKVNPQLDDEIDF
jgi:hypothetical protein